MLISSPQMSKKNQPHTDFIGFYIAKKLATSDLAFQTFEGPKTRKKSNSVWAFFENPLFVLFTA